MQPAFKRTLVWRTLCFCRAESASTARRSARRFMHSRIAEPASSITQAFQSSRAATSGGKKCGKY